MQRLFFMLITFCLFLLIGGCKKPGCLGAAGNQQVLTRTLAPFNELLLTDNINLLLTQGTQEKIIIEAPENMIPNISSDIIDNKLTIANNADCRWARDPAEKINVQLFFTNLKKIVYKGSGNITNTDTLRLAAFEVHTDDGAGNIVLTMDNSYTGAYNGSDDNVEMLLYGRTDVCYTYTNSRGKTDMRDFVVKKMVIEFEGLSDTYINVTEELTATIFHKGNILYKGTPVITQALYHSSGRLIYRP